MIYSIKDVFRQKQPPSAHRHCHKPWFDTECKVEKRHVMTFLKDNLNPSLPEPFRGIWSSCSSVRKKVMKSWGGCVCAKWPKLTPQDFGGDIVRRRKPRTASGGRHSGRALVRCWGRLPHHLIRSFRPCQWHGWLHFESRHSTVWNCWCHKKVEAGKSNKARWSESWICDRWVWRTATHFTDLV